jgi:hypothetical protein
VAAAAVVVVVVAAAAAAEPTVMAVVVQGRRFPPLQEYYPHADSQILEAAEAEYFPCLLQIVGVKPRSEWWQ